MTKRAQYLGPAKRRPLVLDAALEIFAEGGFADASMAAIARRAGITKPVLYDCFPGGKQEIYFALIDREDQRFVAHMTAVLAAAGALPLGESLRAGIGAFLEYAEINPKAFEIIFGSPGSADGEIQRRAEIVRANIVQRLGETARATLQLDVPPVVIEIFTRAIVAVSEELARWWVRDKPMDREMLVASATAWMMRGFEGILPDGATTRANAEPAPAS